MSDWTPAQAAELEDPKRFAIYEFLKGREKPAALGEISRGIDLRDLAKVHRHVALLVDVGVVEKVWGTNRYRLVVGE